ncbi:MAG: hypothetical protein PVI35_01680 [Acidimicrobiia bacterium]|jgi:hypothetical protein
MRHRAVSTAWGAVTGSLLALAALVLFTGRQAIDSIGSVVLSYDAMRIRPQFAISSGGLFLLVAGTALLGGLAVAAITYARSRELDPSSERFPLRAVLPVGAVTGLVAAYAVLRAGLGATATIDAGVVTISAFRMIVVALLAGLVAGGVTAAVVEPLARKQVLGAGGEGWPEDRATFARSMARAVGTPVLAAITIVALAIGLSELLLALGDNAAIAVFSIVAAAVLGGIALFAYRPWDQSGDD